MNKVMKSLLLGSYIWFFGWGLLGPLYAVFAQKIGGDILDMTGAYALYLIVGGLFSIGFGKYSDHVSKEKMMIAGYTLNAAATFGYLFVDSPMKLFFVQALLGLANSLATPTWNAIFARHLDDGQDGEAWGLSSGGPDIVMGLAILLGGFIMVHFGFSALFVLMGTVQVFAAVVQTWTLRTAKTKLITS